MATYELTVSAPNIEDRSFTKPLLCGPGPCDLWPSVSEALAKPVITPLCDEHYNVIDDIRAGLQYIFQTRNKLVYAVSGSGHSGMETIISNLLGPNEVLLIASRGIWDQRANIIANRYGIKTIIISAPFNTTFSHDTLEAALNKHKPTALFITHGDSSTGTVQNLKGLGEICHRDKINNRKHEPPFYFDAKLLAQQWNCYGNTRQYHHTLSPPLLWALRQCLREVAKETLPKSWARHAATTAHFHRRIQQMSLQFLVPKPEDRLATVTTIVLPNGYDYVKFYKYIRDKYNILIFAGLGPTVGKALRIGLMGVNSTIEVADAVADAMMGALKVKSLL
ncbi:serine--pyruvate aminotransferase, mitochondrial isoform X2 [Manduca sexta]|uniref:serine--pyruvate aminotransferase, mitochondrial isoform X2 n=1 Tax=Manduca sexta TaxID=7130 RepID=UPI00188E3C43|nr:serine--pyruvate aminotransferase, mitochondrial isoform X2 [Manduca sexta]